MIRTLRKRHKQIWTLLAFLLPLGILTAWLSVPKSVKDQLFQPSSTVALPLVIKTLKKNNYSISLRSNEDGSVVQLEWINQTALTFPSAFIYEVNPGNNGQELEGAGMIGRIGSRGTYHFPLKKEPGNNQYHFVLYDIIHHDILDRINF
jgi:hypothetical protein